jgi:hypothetical protein
METFLEEMLLIYPLLGLTAFEVPHIESPAKGKTGAPDAVLSLKAKGIIARGYERAEGFVVLAGSTAVQQTLDSCPAGSATLRNSLVKQGLLVPDGELLKLTQDYTFNSPSTAASVMLGSSANGRLMWKDSQGRTLKEIQQAAIPGAVADLAPDDGDVSSAAAKQEEIDESESNDTDSAGAVTLADLIKAGILPAPLKLSGVYKGQTVEADLHSDGSVVFQGTTYASCSQAAVAARIAIAGKKSTVNGWLFWQYCDATGKRHTLDDARNAQLGQ